MAVAAVEYRVEPLSGHRFRLQVRVRGELPSRLDFALPVWIPGSYTRRDFSRHLSGLAACCQNQQLAICQHSPSHWSVDLPAGTSECVIDYEIYARDYSVRGCYLDDQRAIFNPCCACIVITGAENAPHSVFWRPDNVRQNWPVAGAGWSKDGQAQFPDYETLADSPFMSAREWVIESFSAGGISHQIVICGQANAKPQPRLARDVALICQQANKMFARLPPISSYTFLLFLTEKTYGGLEHPASTLLMAPRQTLPEDDLLEPSAGYTQLLGLFSHEYFHLWNVKAMRPREYVRGYDWHKEQPSDMLWLFEGFTAYFDNLLLLRSGVIREIAYLRLLACDISRYLQRRGRTRQTLAQSSLDAWTKLYNGGEDAINSSTNYYIHGALAAWCLDGFLRVHGEQEELSLSKLMRALWESPEYWCEGLSEANFIRFVKTRLPAQVHTAFEHFIHALLHGHEILPLHWVAHRLGLSLNFLASASAMDTGMEVPPEKRASSEPGFRWGQRAGDYFVQQLDPNSAAANSGLAVEDQLLTVNGQRVSDESLWNELFRAPVHALAEVSVLRDGLLQNYSWHLPAALKNTCLIKIDPNAASADQARRRQWFNQTMED